MYRTILFSTTLIFLISSLTIFGETYKSAAGKDRNFYIITHTGPHEFEITNVGINMNVKWFVNGEYMEKDDTGSFLTVNPVLSYIFANVGEYFIEAHYCRNGSPFVWDKYKWHFNVHATISVSAEWSERGTVFAEEHKNLHYGRNTSVFASPNYGYDFINWTENHIEVSKEADYSFTVTEDRILVANFTPKSYTIYTSSGDGGSASGGDFLYKETATVYANAYSGYRFYKWTYRGEYYARSRESNYSFTVTGDLLLEAHFVPKYFTANTSSNPFDGGETTGHSQQYLQPNIVSATPNDGYYFYNWTENGIVVSSNSRYQYTVQGDRTLVANFNPLIYSISTECIPIEGGYTTGGGLVKFNSQDTVVAIANEGYVFKNWTENGTEVSKNSKYSFTVNGQRSLFANFLPVYTISTVTNPEVGGTAEGEGSYLSGNSVTVIASADSGYSFTNWTEDGVEVSASSSYSFGVTSDRSLTANFIEIPPDKYSVTLTTSPADGGSTSGGGSYDSGSTITISTVPDYSRFSFANWTENGVEITTDPSHTFTINNDRTLTANFDILPPARYSIILDSNPGVGGTVSGGGVFDDGSNVSVTATSNSGYNFRNWTDKEVEVSEDSIYTFRINGDRNLAANFKLILPEKYLISIISYPEHGGTVQGGNTYINGSSATVTAIQNPDFTFINWTENGIEASTSSSYTFIVNSDRTITANFTENPKETFRLNLSSNPLEGGTTIGSDLYESGSSAPITAIPDYPKYTFINWTENGTVFSTADKINLTITEDRDLIANFEPITHTISIITIPISGGSTTGGGVYNYGTRVTVVSRPDSGYTFTNWKEDGIEVSTNSSYSFTIQDDRTFTANFALVPSVKYSVNLSSNPGTGGTTIGSGIYDSGTNLALEAIPNNGYTFTNWTDNGAEITRNPSYTLEVYENKNLTANFEIIPPVQYSVSLSGNPENGGSINGGGIFESGSRVTVTASPNSNYTFINWTENGTEVSSNSSYAFAIRGNRILSANFEKIPPVQYSVNLPSNPGTGGTTDGSGLHESGSSVTITAAPNSGYTFTNWTENGAEVSNNSSYTFTISSNKILTANFEFIPPVQYLVSLSANPGAGGTITGNGTYDTGSSVSVTASPVDGYTFANWTENGEEVVNSSSYTFIINSNRTLTANFEVVPPAKYSVVIDTNPANGGTINGGGVYDDGESIIVTAEPNEGYTFTNWKENGIELSTSPNYTFIINANRRLMATFTAPPPVEYSINLLSNPEDGGTTHGGGIYTEGQIIGVSSSFNPWFTFTNWTENGVIVSTSPDFTFTVDDNRTLTANFVAVPPPEYAVDFITHPADGGTTSGGGIYKLGSSVTVTAVPANGYSFTSWSESGVELSTNASYTFTISHNRRLLASFEALPPEQYSINLLSNPEDGGTTHGGGIYTEGQILGVSASFNPWYAFTNWTENGTVVSTSSDFTFMVKDNRTLTANFVAVPPVQHAVNLSVTPPEGGITSGGGIYGDGDSVTVTAMPNSGFTFDQWTEGGEQIMGTPGYTFIINRNRTLIAEFEAIPLPEYGLDIVTSPTEGGTTSGGGIYKSGSIVTVTAIPDSGYTFKTWIGREEGELSTSSSYTFTISRDTVLIAVFAAPPPAQYSTNLLSNPENGGTTNGGGIYTVGQTIGVAASFNDGFNFTNWTEDSLEVSTSPNFSFVVSGNRILTANFEVVPPVQDSLNLSSNPENGGITIGGGIYDDGDTVTVTATSNDGYIFTNWTENGEDVTGSPSYTFIINRSRRLTANFEEIPATMYGVNLTTYPSSAGTSIGAGRFNSGDSIIVTALPEEGYAFTNWTENIFILSDSSTLTIPVTHDMNLAANFEVITSVEEGNDIPLTYSLLQNFPNPFNPSTTIRFGLPEEAQVKLAVYNILGQEITVLVNSHLKAGLYNFDFNASEFSTGVYIYRLQTNKFTKSKKLILMK